MDRPTADYSNFNLGAADVNLCRNACAAENQCRAFTYVHPGVQGPYARCWLKHTVPQAGASSCCISGFKRPGDGMVVRKIGEDRVRVFWQGSPGGSQDWVSIAPAGMVDTGHIGRWAFAPTTSGWVDIGPLTAGVYEVRFYLNNNYIVVSRMAFSMP